MRFFMASVSLISVMVSTLAGAYNLLEPTPQAQLRELSTDRPDTTESPYTVDAGHFQIEWEALSFGRDKSDGVRTETYSSSINLKAGLSDNVDAQLVLEPYTYVKTAANGDRDTDQGINDTEVRLKINIWGNNDGDTAFAIMPFVRFPTHASAFGDNGKTEGGLIFPLAFKLPAEWDSAVMLEFDAVRNEDNTAYMMEIVKSITFGHAISGPLGAFFELVNVSGNQRNAANESYFNSGVMYTIGNDMQLDAGFNLGLSDDAEDIRYFVGASWRF